MNAPFPLGAHSDALCVQPLSAKTTELVRVVVVGSVDDGKSSLIGRLLYECDGLYDDQIACIRKRSVDGVLDFSLFTDGLLAEREQGITIDVAYRYFSTRERKVIVADTPGHVQYTRNMATGASTADAVVILVDARLGVLAQTRRHAFIAALLGIPHVAVAINKIDLVDDAHAVFARLSAEVRAFTSALGFRSAQAFPVSALRGDNIVHPSPQTPWHDGATILSWLNALPLRAGVDDAPLRFAVQAVLRPTLDYRGYAGTVSAGTVRPGDDVLVMPSGLRTEVAAIDTFDGPKDAVRAPAAVVLRLRDDVDVARGDMIASIERPPQRRSSFDADLVWFGDAPLLTGHRYLLKHTTRRVSAHVEVLRHRYDLETLGTEPASSLAQNDIGRVRLVCSRPLVVDPYTVDRSTGAFILIDRHSNDTVAAGMIAALDDEERDSSWRSDVEAHERSARLGHRGLVFLVDDEGAGRALERRLFDEGAHTALCDDVDDAAVLAGAGLVAVLVARGAQRRCAGREALEQRGVSVVDEDAGWRPR